MAIKIQLNNANINSVKQGEKENDIRLEDISIMYTTEKTEENRSTFEETFKEVPVNQTPEGKKFLEGLINNKESLSKELGLDSEEYDNLACVALALASQETGMGEEKGYVGENKGIKKLIRSFLKLFDDSSASSGLTQMKIHDFLNSDKLTEKEKEIIEKYGIKSKGKSSNNLYKNPDKSAIATMVVLSSIANNYDNYRNILNSKHEELTNGFTDSDAALQKGNDVLNNIINFYGNMPNADSQKEFRETLKQFILSKDGTKSGDKIEDDYNEEIQLNKLNEILSSGNADFILNIEDLNYIRYTLTASGQEMSYNEYCAYGWNKGTGETGMQTDRLLADKIGTILATPENFDYDQFTVNVTTLAGLYANQSY